MFTVSTTLVRNSRGASIRATCKGKQSTYPLVDTDSIRRGTGAAAGMVLAKVLSPEQRAKVLHPSGAQRVTVMTFNDGSGKVNVTV
jgi:hypothetical protein